MDRCGVTIAQEREYDAAMKVKRDKVRKAIVEGLAEQRNLLIGDPDGILTEYKFPHTHLTGGDMYRLALHLTAHVMRVL